MSTASATGVDAGRLRAAIGHFATGVGVVTAVDDRGRPLGSTANAIASVSLHPPLVLVCLRDESETLGSIIANRVFAINLLRDDQRHLAERFAQPTAPGTWTGVPHRPAPVTGGALLDDALATLECELHTVADGGDHTIAIGRVVAVEHPTEHVPPLLFYRGTFTETPAAAPAREEATPISLPSEFGDLRLLAVDVWHERSTSVIALVGEPEGTDGTHVYVHEGCLLGDALGHVRCPGRGRLHTALDLMRAAGRGVVVYHRDDAGIGACCLETDTSARAAGEPTDAGRHALEGLRLRRVRLLGGSDGRQAAFTLGLDVAEVVEA